MLRERGWRRDDGAESRRRGLSLGFRREQRQPRRRVAIADGVSLRMDGDDDDREEFEQDPDDEVDDQMEPEDDNENVGADAMMENGGAEEEGAGGGEEAGARKTTGYLTKYERARVLGTRALQIRCVAGTGGKNCV